MSVNPFVADRSIARRCEEIAAGNGPKLLAEAENAMKPDGFLPASAAGKLIESFDLGGIDTLMRLLLPLARRFSRPVISGFEVGAIGLERETAGLIFGGNIEFPGTHLGLTIHGETAVSARAFGRGHSLARIALGEAHPCGHCRQFLSEFADAGALRLIDPLGHDLGLADLLPWPFDPIYLGEKGTVAGQAHWPRLALEGSSGEVWRDLLSAAGRLAHAPYTRNPAAAVLVLKDGRMIAGQSIESVAYNPSMGPLQAAIVNLAGWRFGGETIAEIHLAERRDAAVCHADQARLLARTYAPSARLAIHHWETVDA